MKKAMLIGVAVLFCLSAFCDESWSSAIHFDGRQITSDAVILRPNDPIAYSSSFAEGNPVSLDIAATDTADPTIVAAIFSDDSGTAVEGTTVWDYTTESYSDLPKNDTYQIRETVTSDSETQVLTRNVTLLPEPFAFLALAVVGALFLRKRTRVLAVTIIAAASMSLSARANALVDNVTIMQGWPFTRNVIINYTLTSTSADPVIGVKFYGTTDNGETTFDLSEYGTLSKDGADGIIKTTGAHKTFWTPNESFYETVTDGFKVKVEAVEMLYMVLDLSGGTSAQSYPVSYLADVPEGGWTSEYKTTKLVLRKVEPGTFTMGSPSNETGRNNNSEYQHQVTLTKAFYIGVFEATQKQYELVMGSNPSNPSNIHNEMPVEQVTYDALRGASAGAGWPTDNAVDETSFFGVLRAKTSLTFDLPTDAQWEYACRAETTTALNNGKNLSNDTACSEMNEVGRYQGNREDGKWSGNGHTPVGLYRPNAWGLYDMHGNVWEWCLDYLTMNLGTAAVTDPKGPNQSGSYNNYRVARGGGYTFAASQCRSARRSGNMSTAYDSVRGFRITLTLN